PGSNGTFAIQSGTQSPLSLVSVSGPTQGTHQAMLDQQDLTPLVPGVTFNPNAASTYAGAHALYQDVFVPAGTTSLTLSFSLYINNQANGYSTPPDGHLDEPFAKGVADQQVRVDIMDPTDPNGVLDTTVAPNGVL